MHVYEYDEPVRFPPESKTSHPGIWYGPRPGTWCVRITAGWTVKDRHRVAAPHRGMRPGGKARRPEVDRSFVLQDCSYAEAVRWRAEKLAEILYGFAIEILDRDGTSLGYVRNR